MGLILFVRDPRDVLCSRHSGASPDQAYVTPEHWHASIRAGEALFENLRDYEAKVVASERCGMRSTMSELTLMSQVIWAKTMIIPIARTT